jgi:hypothetical protein
MASTLPTAGACCTSCDDTISVAVPGAAGSDGADGAGGADGVSAFSTTTAQFVMPAEGANVSVTVDYSTWMTAIQVVYIQNAGYLEVQSKADSTHVVLKNLKNTAGGAYLSNVAPATVVAVGNQISPGGLQGSTGAAAAGAFAIALNLSEGTPVTMRNNLLLTSLATATSGIAQNNYPPVTPVAGLVNGESVFATATGVETKTAAATRTALSLVPGTNVQAYDAFLLSIATLGTAADKMLYTTAANTAAEADLPAFGRTLVANTTAALALEDLDKTLPRHGILGYRAAIDLNTATTDYAITISGGTRYRVEKVVVENGSISITTATAGLFTAGGGGGTAIANDQALAALTSSAKFLDLTLQAVAGTDLFSAGTLYFRVGTPQGAAATATVWVHGWRFD